MSLVFKHSLACAFFVKWIVMNPSMSFVRSNVARLHNFGARIIHILCRCGTICWCIGRCIHCIQVLFQSLLPLQASEVPSSILVLGYSVLWNLTRTYLAAVLPLQRGTTHVTCLYY